MVAPQALEQLQSWSPQHDGGYLLAGDGQFLSAEVIQQSGYDAMHEINSKTSQWNI